MSTEYFLYAKCLDAILECEIRERLERVENVANRVGVRQKDEERGEGGEEKILSPCPFRAIRFKSSTCKL